MSAPRESAEACALRLLNAIPGDDLPPVTAFDLDDAAYRAELLDCARGALARALIAAKWEETPEVRDATALVQALRSMAGTSGAYGAWA